MNYSSKIVYGYESRPRPGDYLPRPIVGLLVLLSLVPRREGGRAPGIHCLRMRVITKRNNLVPVGEDGDDIFYNAKKDMTQVSAQAKLWVQQRLRIM